MIDYEREMLRRGEAFRVTLAKNNPGHADLGCIDADIAARRIRINFLQQLSRPVSAESQKANEEKIPERDLRQETLDLLANNTFRAPTAEEQKVLKPLGYDIFLTTDSKTLYAVVYENQDYFWNSALEYVKGIRDYVPPILTVGLRSRKLFIKDSFAKSQNIQLQMHEAESQAAQGLIPTARNIMLPASTDAQLDLAYYRKTGQVLFKEQFVRALDETSDVPVADVGRDHPDSRLDISGWARDDGNDGVGALSAVVFLQK